MLYSVLKSEQAIKVNIAIKRAFVQMRRMFASLEDLKKSKRWNPIRQTVHGNVRGHPTAFGRRCDAKAEDRVLKEKLMIQAEGEKNDGREYPGMAQ